MIRHNLDNRDTSESGGGGDGDWTDTPAEDAAGVAASRPKHRASAKYNTLALESPTRDQANRARVERGERTTGSPVEKE